ncbi:VOC family protein [Flexivirga caeni]|uniref:VOC family protein n=1 Tax=Flexivirga caeni TaxID=2294115 RepID=A0A3M9M4C1_9MICO|nr:VOC family protein [Flexivirga caeni]RNI20336.1 VOC family protein [Flexivirga caeni]
MAEIRMQTFVLDTPDPQGLAAFYGELLGWPVVDTDDDWVQLAPRDGAVGLGLQLAPDHVPPTWPDNSVPMQAHLDLEVDDYDSTEARVLALGGRKVGDDAAHPGFRVYLDPSGHPFCLCLAGNG